MRMGDCHIIERGRDEGLASVQHGSLLQSPQPPQPPQLPQPPASTLNQLLALSFDGHSACLIPAPAITAPIHPKAWPVNANVSARAPKVVQKIKETAVFIAVLLSDRFCCDSVNAKRVPGRVGTALAPNCLMKRLDLGTNRNVDVRACR